MVQENLYRQAEVGWQLSGMYAEQLCLTAGTPDFHPLWNLSQVDIDKTLEDASNIQNQELRDFTRKHIHSVLRKRREYFKAYKGRDAKGESDFKIDFRQGTSLMKQAAVVSHFASNILL